MLHFRTQGFNGCAVKYSPFFDNRLAVASAANFGLVGNGRLYILELTPNGIVPVKWCVDLFTCFTLSPRGCVASTQLEVSPRNNKSMIGD